MKGKIEQYLWENKEVLNDVILLEGGDSTIKSGIIKKRKPSAVCPICEQTISVGDVCAKHLDDCGGALYATWICAQCTIVNSNVISALGGFDNIPNDIKDTLSAKEEQNERQD
jgi:hypothetical protein